MDEIICSGMIVPASVNFNDKNGVSLRTRIRGVASVDIDDDVAVGPVYLPLDKEDTFQRFEPNFTSSPKKRQRLINGTDIVIVRVDEQEESNSTLHYELESEVEDSETEQDEESNLNSTLHYEAGSDNESDDETFATGHFEELDTDTDQEKANDAGVEKNTSLELWLNNDEHGSDNGDSVHSTSDDNSEEDEERPVLFWNSQWDSHLSNEVTQHTEETTGNTSSTGCRNVQVAFDIHQAADLLTTTCCDLGCLQKVNISEVLDCRRNKCNKAWVLEQLKTFRNGDSHTSTFVAHGKSVCSGAWKALYGVSDSLFMSASRLQDDGVVEVIHKNKLVVRNCQKSINCRTWLSAFIKMFGESMPHLNLVLLPSALTKKMIFNKMHQEYLDQKTDHTIVKWRQFYNVWNVYFPKVKIRKETCFTKCTPCTVAAEQRGKTMDKAKKEAIQEVLDKHLQTAKRERMAYERHKAKAHSDSKYLCISVDGMDQSKTTLPHLTRIDKGSQHLWRLRTHVTGALVHGTMDYGKDVTMYINTAEIASDSNLTLNILINAMQQHVRKYNKLPEKLYLQFDNCWRENKNKYILCFAYLLVAMGIVKKVRINFLIVGHTHNDVDQAFSRLAEALRRLSAHTLEALEDIIQKSCSKPSPDVVVLDHVYDFKSWLEPHISGQFKGHSKPHCFRIYKRDNITLMQYRQYTGDKWEPSEGLQCMKTVPDIANVPEWVSPIMERLCLNMIRLHIPKFYHRLAETDQMWWNKYLEDIDRNKQVPAKTTHWPLMSIAAAAGQQSYDETEDPDNALPESLQPIWRKLNAPMPPVTIGSQGKHVRPTVRDIQDAEGTSEIPASASEEDMNQEIETEGATEYETDTSEQDDDNDLLQFQTIKKGDMCAVYVNHHFSGSPQIGLVKDVDIEEETIHLHWFSASWTGKCTPLWYGVGANRKPKTELIDIRCALLWQFKLTKSSCIPSRAAAKLRRQYSDLQISSQA